MEPPPTAIPASTVGTRLERGRRLTPKMLEDAATRLAGLALALAIVIPAVEIFQRVSQPSLAPIIDSRLARLATLAAVLMAVAVFVVRYFRLANARTVLALGMVFEVAVAFCVSMIETSVPPVVGRPVMGLSSIGAWVLAVGVFIPNRPAWTLAVGTAAATTWPLAYALNASLLEFPPIPLGQLMVWPVFNYLFAVLAFLAGRRLYGMTLAAQHAIELGSYRLDTRIGSGGMGEVWRARHRMLARAAAIKLIRAGLESLSARQTEALTRRFRREANAIAGLQSPHTIYLYDFGVSQDGRFYYVMELLDGISLQTLVTTFGPQPPSRVVALLTQICQSLEEAHAKGIVHRDLKPSNVMICEVALTHDVVKVLDFGLAKLVGPEEDSQLTAVGTAAGTPAYMAPEVAMNEGGLDGRADIYALGCVACFLLTGTLVFPESTPMGMAIKHVQAQPEPLSTRTELPVPVDLEALVLQCLSKRPDDRPARAAVVAERLAACRVDRWTEAHARAWWDRHLPPGSSLRVGSQRATGSEPEVANA